MVMIPRFLKHFTWFTILGGIIINFDLKNRKIFRTTLIPVNLEM